MKKKVGRFLMLMWVACAITVDAQVRMLADQMPEFAGGEKALNSWIANNMRYPSEAIERGESGKVVVKFIIDEDGNVSSPSIQRGCSPALNKEALRIVSAMPKWQPAVHEGEPCAIQYLLPIVFKLQDDSDATSASSPAPKEETKAEVIQEETKSSAQSSAVIAPKDDKVHIYYFGNKPFAFAPNASFSTVNHLAQGVTGDRRGQKRNGAYYYKGQMEGFYEKEQPRTGGTKLFFVEPEMWIYLSDNGRVSHIAQKITCTAHTMETVDETLRKIMTFVMNRTDNGTSRPRSDAPGGYENARETFEISYCGSLCFEQDRDGRYVGSIEMCEWIKH